MDVTQRRRVAGGVSSLVLFLAVVLASASAGASAPALTDPHWVSFHSARAVPSALARRVLGASVDAARPRKALRGLLVVPDGDGPFPAVVLMHGCRGVLASQRGWAQWFARHGFVALLVDSFFTRHASGVCSLRPEEGARQEVGGRVFDAFGALDFLGQDPRVDPQRVAIMGWNSWIPLSAVSRGGPRALVNAGFSAAVAVSPDCPLDAGRPAVPVLILAAADDELHSARNCERLALASAGALELRVLPGAGHGFDDASAGAQGVSKAVFHLASASTRSVPVRYDRTAHERAAQEVLDFLSPRLGARSGPDPLIREPGIPVGAHWVVDPSRPGADRPAAGRSLFDRVFADSQGQVRVPFPFARVLDRLEQELGAPRGSRQGLAISLVPLGRSLQRAAAAPDFFRYPRVVVAVDGEPMERPEVRWLKDRMFLGYQEKARVIEAISYNETLGRFEFQVVEGYAPGQVPRVRYANRTVCVSCHQNGAPIFSRAAWDETNTNMDVARRLRNAGGGFHGLTGAAGAEAAARVDNATDRANLLSAWQRIWRQACGDGDARGRACRGAALVAMIQDRLSGSSGHDRNSRRYRRDFLAPVTARWEVLWPGGLAVPDPDLVNREPALEPTPTEIAARDDPLTPRPPAALWQGARDAHRLIPGLAQSLPWVDLAALDRHLLSEGRHQALPRSTLATGCRVSRRGTAGGHHRITLACKGAGPRSTPAFEMALDVRGRAILGGSARYLNLGDGVLLERVQVLPLAASGGRVSLTLRQGQSGWSVRTIRGHALDRIDLDWSRVEEAADTGVVLRDLAVVRLMDDFRPLVDAVASMVDDAGVGGLGATTFRPVGLMGRVMSRLGVEHPAWCCEVAVKSPVEVADRNTLTFLTPPTGPRQASTGISSERHGVDAVVATFNRRCGSCHRAPAPMPPGFLHGSRARVERALMHCAPRIALRLSMWQLEPDRRERSPMPPPRLLGSQGLDEAGWTESGDYRQLLDWARKQASVREGGDLPGCLPGEGALAKVPAPER